MAITEKNNAMLTPLVALALARRVQEPLRGAGRHSG